MKKMMIVVILALLLAFSIAGAGLAADPTTAWMDKPGPRQQVTCPVQAGKINKNLYTDYKGQRIYFCCPECLTIFKTNPEAYLKKMQQEGVTPEKAPALK